MKKVLLYISLCLSIVYGQKINVNIDSGVESFCKTGMNSFHRSGEQDKSFKSLNRSTKSQTSSIFSDEKEDVSLSECWHRGFDFEYQVMCDKPDNATKQKLSSLFGKYGFGQCLYDTVNAVMVFRRAGSQLVPSMIKANELISLGVDTLHAIASAYSEKLLSSFQNQIEFQNEEVEEVNDQIAYYTMRFRRIFRHGIVLGNLSYVSLKITGDGSLAEIAIKWPKFKKLASKNASCDIEKAIVAAGEIYAETPDAEKDDLKVSAIKADVNGIALAWREEISNSNSMIITPCYAFKAEVMLANGQSAPYFIEVPRLLKYYR